MNCAFGCPEPAVSRRMCYSCWLKWKKQQDRDAAPYAPQRKEPLLPKPVIQNYRRPLRSR
jgi:hypothetical protein